MSAADGLARAFSPKTVAVVGASPSSGKAGNALMRSLAGFGGSVYPVHPSAEEVLGIPAHRSIGDIPAPVDLALIAVPAVAVVDAVRECSAAGVGGVIVHAGGFAETGSDGVAAQSALAQAARSGGDTRLLGPNTSGFIAPPIALRATFVASTEALVPGPLAIVAQSGGVNHALAFAAHSDGLGVRLAVGLGNAADIGFADVLDHLANDDGVGVVALAIEGVADGRALIASVERVCDRVPVVALTLGRGDVGDFAQSHTGALTGKREVTRAALRQAGAVVVEDSTELLDAARALAVCGRLGPRAQPGVGVITGQAGPGLLLADTLSAEGVSVPELPAGAQAHLKELLGNLTYQRNPVDTGRPGPNFADVVRTVGDVDGIDALAIYLLDEPDAVDAGAVLSGVGGVPIVVGTAGPPADLTQLRDRLAEAAIAVMPTPERAAGAVAALVRDAELSARRAHGRSDVGLGGTAMSFGESDAPWDEIRAKELLSSLGIPTPRRAECATQDEAIVAAREIGWPVVLKLVHPQLLHKTEVGAVRVGLGDEAELRAALEELEQVELPSPGRLLVEAMASGGPELLLGAVRDPAFGPVVLLGSGGIDAEAAPDVATRIAPLHRKEAATMIGELAGAARYRGHRGRPAVDEASLAEVIVAVGGLLDALDLSEIEINPLRVTADGLVALDALVVPRQPVVQTTGSGDLRHR